MSVYPRIIELAKQGLTPSRIADRLGCSPSTVSRYLNEARRSGVEVPRFTASVESRGCRRVAASLPRHLFDALNAQAEALQIAPERLAAQLLAQALTAQALFRPRAVDKAAALARLREGLEREGGLVLPKTGGVG